MGNISYFLLPDSRPHVARCGQASAQNVGNWLLPVAEFILLLVVALSATILAGALLFLAIEKPLSFSSPRVIRGQGPSTAPPPGPRVPERLFFLLSALNVVQVAFFGFSHWL